MAFPFDTIPHKEYPNTFLENTTVSLFSKKWDGVFKDSFEVFYPQFVDRFFGLKKTAQEFKDKPEMSVTAPENDITYTFRPDKVNLQVGRKKYHTFVDSMIPELLPLKAFMYGVMECDSIENLQVRKLNIFPIQAESIDEVKKNILNIYKYIFKSELLNTVIVDKTPQNAHWIVDFRRGKFSDNEDEVTIRLAIAQVHEIQNSFNVVLDSSARCLNPSDIGEGAVDRILLRLNDQLFNAFHWCVNKDIIQLMEKESN